MTTSALVAAGLVVLAPAPQAAEAAEVHLTGLVYVDYAQDGVYSSGNAASTAIANDLPLAGVMVTAYDANNVVVGSGPSTATLTATPRSNYDITLSGSVANGEPIRVEFTDLPASSYDSFAGADNGTTVQFTTAGAGGIDLGVASAAEYNPGDPGIATSIQSAGVPSPANDRPAVVATAWGVAQNAPLSEDATACTVKPSNCASFAARTTFASFFQVGAVWGLAYDAAFDQLFVAATYKRMSGLKEHAADGLGLGGIYLANDILDPAGRPKPSDSVSNWLDVTTLIDPGTGVGIDIGQGDIQTNAARGIGVPGTPATDISGFALSAKVGIGAISIDPLSRTLYFMNLKNSTVYGVNLDTKALVGSWPVPVSGTQRAYAVAVHKGQLLVGYNDTGATGFQPAATAGLSYYVARATIGANGTLGGFAQVLDGSLGYNKGNPIYNWQSSGNAIANDHPQVLRWNTWTDQWTSGVNSVGFTSSGSWGTNNTHVYPQAVLSTLAIDSAGFLTVGFQDRTAIQGGNRNFAAVATPGNTYFETVSGGDMLLAAPKGDGTYVQESNGTAGTRTAQAGRDQQLPVSGATAGGEGPGRNEFYYDRQNRGTGSNHREASLGAVVAAPGVAQVVSTLMDPLGPVRVTGVAWFDSTNGNNVKGYQHTQDDGSTTPSASFQKGGGMGAVSLVVKAAPVEIGNRVWYDADLNGRQDADEPAINGAPVSLYTADADGAPATLLETTTTATINGEPGTYYFRSEDAAGGVPGFKKNAKYVVVFGKLPEATVVDLQGPNASNPGFAGLTWGDMVRTAPASSQATPANDSNPDAQTGYAPVTVGSASQNDHTIDAGWYGTTTYEIKKSVVGTVPPESSWTVNVSSAVNFRGDGRLADGTPAPTFTTTPGDPLVTQTSFTLTANETITTTQALPYGYKLGFVEAGMPASAVSISPSSLVISPAVKTPAVDVLVTNSYTGFSVAKLITGPTSTAEFPIDYEYSYTPVGASEPTKVEGSGTVTTATGLNVTGIPVGATVKVKEGSPLPSIPGWTWNNLTWTVDGAPQTPDGDGWVSFTAETTTSTALALTNVYTQVTGGFSVSKARATGEPLANQTFAFEYAVGATGTAQSLGAIAAGDKLNSPTTIPYGSTVRVREVPPTDLPNLTWAAPVWTGLPAGATGPDASGWYSFVLVPATPGAVVALTATNKATELFGQFTVSKTVVVSGNPDVAGKVFDLEYRTAPAPAPSAEPVFVAPVPLKLTGGATSAVVGNLPFGTIVQVREIQPENKPGVAWGTPVWTVNDAPPAVSGEWTQFTIGATSTVAFAVTNTATETYGAFTLRKAFDGTGIPLVSGLSYPVDVKIGGGEIQRVALKGDGTIWSGTKNRPVGTIVKVKEVTPLPAVDGIVWGAPAWSAASGTTVTTDSDGWTVFTITSDSAAAALTVTNKPTQEFGQFQVKKTLVTSGNPQVPAAYTIEYTLDGGTPTSVTLAAGQLSAVVGGLPFGTKLKVREVAPAATPGVQWATTWKIGDAAATPDADGWVTTTIDATTLISFEVTNTATQLFGQFQIGKSVHGNGADLVPADTVYSFAYTLGDGDPQVVTATAAAASAIVGGLPFGTVVTVAEVQFPVIPGIEWTDPPAWTINGAPVDGPVTFTIDGTTLVTLAADNTATRVYGSFDLTKAITGDGASRVPEKASFTVEYSLDEGATWTALPAITKQNLTVSGPDILVGTHVLVREVAPKDGTDFAWGTPQFVVDGQAQGASGSFTLTAKDQTVAIGLTNTASARNGSFTVQKAVAGDFSLTDPALSDRTFSVNWSGGGRSGVIELNAADGWKAGPGAPQFPVGTKITLTEAAVTGLPPHVQFDGSQWLAGVPGVTVSADGKTATLVVASGDPAALVVTNTFTALSGTFEVEKVVDGPFALTDPELADLRFTVNYASAAGNGSLLLDAAGDWKAQVGSKFPTGTVVTLTEAPVDQTTLAPNVQWSGYTWIAGDGVTVSADGLTATITVGDNTNTALQVKNSFSELTGSFAVQKVVDGDFALTDPELSGLTFSVDYTSASGNGTLTLNAANGWTAAPSATLPRGTVVTLTELTPSGYGPSVHFDGYTWLAGSGVTVSPDGLTASITVGGAPARLQVKNTFSELTGTFGVHKLIAGDFPVDAPEFDALSFAVNYTGSDGSTGVLQLNEAGGWTAPAGVQFAAGTVITLSEAEVVGLPAYMQWNGATWLPGAGYTVAADGSSASLTVGAGADPQVSVQNSFSELVGGFTVTKDVAGPGADRVPSDFGFAVEYSLDGGATWVALPTVTKAAPLASGPSDLRLGSTVLVREIAPSELPDVTWGTPAFSGIGVTPGAGGAPASFVVDSTETAVNVLLTNPTSPLNGQFQVTKKITGAGSSLMSGDPVFTVKYSYAGHTGELAVKAGKMASSEPIPAGTVVTITEVAPAGGLVAGASWGAPVFVLPDGSALTNGSTITIGADTVIALVLENPTIPPLPPTGGQLPWLAGGFALLMLLSGFGAVWFARRRRGEHA